MVKTIVKILIVSAFVLSLSKLSFAMGCGSADISHSKHTQIAQAESSSKYASEQPTTVKKAEDVGNKICPVSGEKIDEKTKATYEYKGKIYNFCCPMCIDEFKKDPEKYIKKVEEELHSKSKEETKKEPSSHEGMEGMHTEGMHEGHH